MSWLLTNVPPVESGPKITYLPRMAHQLGMHPDTRGSSMTSWLSGLRPILSTGRSGDDLGAVHNEEGIGDIFGALFLGSWAG